MDLEKMIIPFGPLKGVEWITGHAMNRFRDRTGATGTHGEVLKKIEGWIKQAQLAKVKPGMVMNKMFRHGCRATTYFILGSVKKGNGWIIVVERTTLKTIHKNDSGEWMLAD